MFAHVTIVNRVISHSKFLLRGRRESETHSDRSPLWERLLECHEECYGTDAGGGKPSPYSDYLAANVKERPAGSPVVHLVEELPPPIAEVISSPTAMFRPLSQDDEAHFADLNRRYSHFCGAKNFKGGGI